MAKLSRLAATLAFAPMILAAGSADAFEGACAGPFDDVASAIASAGFPLTGKGATAQSNLEAKLAAADAKFWLKKWGDSVDKLLSISNSALTLAADGKYISAEAGTLVSDAAIGAIVCVRECLDGTRICPAG